VPVTGIDELPTQLRQKWAAARVWAASQAPYLATALLALEPVVVPTDTRPTPDLCRLPADPRWHIYIDEQVLSTTDVPVLGFWVLHQVTHLLRDHAERYPGSGRADQVRWNAAADAEINDDLVAGDVQRPAEAVTPSALGLDDGRTAEEYWDALGGSTAPLGSGECGSCVDGQPRGWDLPEGGLGRLGAELVRRDAVSQMQAYQSRGDLPAGWQRWVDEVTKSTVNWRRMLAAAIRRGVAEVAGRVDFTYRRPSRRNGAVPDVILPSLRQPLPQVAIVLDTSGSMGAAQLGQALGEINGVLRGLGLGRGNLRLVCCDAQAYQVQKIMDAKDVRLMGGGGTDMGAGLAAALELRPRPHLVVVLTDGHTPWPRPPARVRVVVGLLDPTGTVPPWATKVPVDATRTLAQ
jgi:predicted metal-dependent peptidase